MVTWSRRGGAGATKRAASAATPSQPAPNQRAEARPFIALWSGGLDEFIISENPIGIGVVITVGLAN